MWATQGAAEHVRRVHGKPMAKRIRSSHWPLMVVGERVSPLLGCEKCGLAGLALGNQSRFENHQHRPARLHHLPPLRKAAAACGSSAHMSHGGVRWAIVVANVVEALVEVRLGGGTARGHGTG